MNQGFLGQFGQGGDYGHAPDQFRDQAKLDQVFGLHLAKHLCQAALFFAFDRSAKANARCFSAVFNDFFNARKSTAADEQNVRGVDLQEVLIRMLAAALGRDAGHRAFNQFQQGLLHTFAGHVTGDRGVVGLA